MVNEVNARPSSANMLANEKFKCLADAARKPIYEKIIGVVTSGIRADCRDQESMQFEVMEK